MKINEVFTSAYFKAEDLNGGSKDVIIENCTQQEIGEDRTLLPVMDFSNADKSLVVNKTNWNTIAASLGGDDTTEWHGKTITLFKTEVSFSGKMVDCIRISIPDKSEAKPEGDKINLDTEVPF